jgi:hypothetical protein
VNRRVLFVLLIGAAVLGAVAFMTLSGPDPAPAETAEERPAPAPAAPARAPAPPPPAAPEPAKAPAPRRAAAPKPEAAPAPAPEAPAPDPELVTLIVDSDVPGAQVFVDRNFVGKTPLTTTEIKAGSHTVNVSSPGFEGIAQSVSLSPGTREVMFKLREVRLDAQLDVVHKHRMGNCKGRLVATPQGLRYETTDKDDAFRAGLLDLETFEIDYLEKNLRIKSKSGKRFDFTDPDGNADRLFVFHRDVEKARERLKKGDPPAGQ